MISFIIGKACEDYIETLERLDRTLLKLPNLNDDSFTNWKINKHPEHTPRKVYNNNVLDQGFTPAFLAGDTASIPNPGFIGRIYVDTQAEVFYRDYGNAWVQIGGSGGGGGGFIPYMGANQSIDLGYNNFQVNGVAIVNNQYLDNIGIGDTNNLLNSTGVGNIGIGRYTLIENTNGAYNVAIGFNTLTSNRNGTNNVAIGNNALAENISGSENIAIGTTPLIQLTNGNFNIVIGTNSGQNLIDGSGNIFIGYYLGNIITNGIDNVFLGNFGNSGYTVPTQNSNILIGTDAAGVLLANFNQGYWETKDCINQNTDNTAIGNANFFQSELQLGTGQIVLPAAPVTIDTAIKLNINGVDYWLQASTTPPVNTSTIGIQNDTGNALINFDAVANGSNIIDLSPNIVLGTGLTNGNTTALLVGNNTIILSNATQPFSVVNVQDYATTGSLAYTTTTQPNNSVTITLTSITAPIIADGILITIA